MPSDQQQVFRKPKTSGSATIFQKKHWPWVHQEFFRKTMSSGSLTTFQKKPWTWVQWQFFRKTMTPRSATTFKKPWPRVKRYFKKVFDDPGRVHQNNFQKNSSPRFSNNFSKYIIILGLHGLNWWGAWDDFTGIRVSLLPTCCMQSCSLHWSCWTYSSPPHGLRAAAYSKAENNNYEYSKAEYNNYDH